VNTGPVVVSRVIDVLEVAYNALGDTVNTAARLESAASPGMILASEATSRLIAPLFEFQPVGPLSLKGKEGRVASVQIIGIRTVTGKARGIPGLTSPLVGRDNELALLQESIQAASEGRGQIVAVIGEAGIGKSRLAADAQQESPQIRWLEGRCLSYAANIPYLPFLDLLREWLEVTPADHEAKVRIELRAALDRLFAGRADEVYPYLAAMLRLPLEPEVASRIADLSAESLQHQTFTVMREWAIRLSADRPVALILDDLHWADATSLALLEALFDVTEQAPVLLTVLLRPEREHGSWRLNDLARQRYPHRHVEILLRPLTDVHAGQLVSNLLATPGFPRDVRDQILMKAEGNPFFVEEVVRGLIESGTLVQEGDEWRAARPVTALDIPDSIQAVLVSRIDRLSDEARRVLQAASVVGRLFPLDVLKTVLDENGKVDAALVDLQRLELVLERRRIPQPEYRFKHALTQEVAYGTLVEGERRRLHREVARALEAQYAGRLEEVYGLLAYHYDQSQEEERALHFLVRAGDKSRAEYADAEALRHYARAVELMKQRGEWEAAAKTLMKAALAYHIALDFPAANLAYRDAFEILERLPPPGPSPLPPAELRWAMPEPETIDNISIVTPMSATVTSQVFEGLLRHDQGLNVTPAAARSWEISKDGTRYVFRLYQDRAWSDGRQVTAHDFVFAWLRALRGNQSVLLHDITGAKRFQQGATDDPASVGARALDDHTLEVVLDGPRAYFPFILAHPATHPYPRWTIEQYGDDWTAPGHLVANGPYLIVEWKRGNFARLAANPRYAGPRSGNVGKVRFVFKTARGPALFADGEADVQWLLALGEHHTEPFREYLHLDAPQRVLYIFFRCDQQPFRDRRLRLAFAHATDQQALARAGGVQTIPADGAFIPPPIPGHSPHTSVPFDPMRARQLLAEAGVPHGQGLGQFNLLVPSVAETQIYEVLTKTWKDILGVEVAVTVRGLAYLQEIHANPPAVGRLAWLADTPDPDNFLRVNFHSTSDSPTRWKNSTFDALVEEAQDSTDHRRRMALYHEADRLLVADEAVVIPLVYTRTMTVVQPYVRGWWSTFLSPSRIADLIVEREDSARIPEGTQGRNMNHRTIREKG
ncbi:MAG: ABC transporter substrate-binding protein, partial [bacterium]